LGLGFDFGILRGPVQKRPNKNLFIPGFDFGNWLDGWRLGEWGSVCVWDRDRVGEDGVSLVFFSLALLGSGDWGG